MGVQSCRLTSSPAKYRRNNGLKLGTWNVRTMTTGLNMDNDNEQDYNLRKTAVIDRELTDRQIDITVHVDHLM